MCLTTSGTRRRSPHIKIDVKGNDLVKTKAMGILFLVPFLAIMLLTACSSGEPAKGVSVVASFYPMYEVARQVGGDRATVRNLVPAGTEPHEFEPTPQETAAVLKAKIVVYDGAGFEAWMDRLLPDLKKKGVTLVEATSVTALIDMTDEEDPARKVPDPHVWTDPALMQKVVSLVRDAYIKVDPAGEETYEANADAYSARLGALDQKFQQELKGYTRRTFVTTHAAFSYLAKRHNLEQIAIAGLSPIDEPSAQQLAAISRMAKEQGIRYIFFETLVSPRLAETIAREVGAATEVLNPVEGLTDEEIRAGKDYISVMEENLANLKKAFEASK